MLQFFLAFGFLYCKVAFPAGFFVLRVTGGVRRETRVRGVLEGAGVTGAAAAAAAAATGVDGFAGDFAGVLSCAAFVGVELGGGTKLGRLATGVTGFSACCCSSSPTWLWGRLEPDVGVVDFCWRGTILSGVVVCFWGVGLLFFEGLASASAARFCPETGRSVDFNFCETTRNAFQ